MGVTSLDVATGFGGRRGSEYFEANFLLIKTK
jgi:hypothetical protein